MLIQINQDWQSVSDLSGLPDGTALMVQSQSSGRVYVKQQPVPPSGGSVDAVILESLDAWQITPGSSTTWVRTAGSSGQLFIEVL